MKPIKIAFCIITTSLLLLSCESATEPDSNPQPTNDFMVDPFATDETVSLYRNLKELAKRKILFGHQDDLAYGIGWSDEQGESDIYRVVQDYPAVYGWDIGALPGGNILDGVNFNSIREWIQEGYSRGGVITISMHLDNPTTGNDAWDNSQAVTHILPDGPDHDSYMETLMRIASFLQSLTDADSRPIPVFFRPYHEHNHNWPWWGASSCTPEEYNELWRMTVSYLRDERELHNLIYVISPQEVDTREAYLHRYPGDDWVDVLGLDNYQLYRNDMVSILGAQLSMITQLAEEKNKFAALTEVGAPITETWWTQRLLKALKQDEFSRSIAWALVWRNASEEHHFAPYPGHVSVPDFYRFYADSLTMFESQLPDLYGP